MLSGSVEEDGMFAVVAFELNGIPRMNYFKEPAPAKALAQEWFDDGYGDAKVLRVPGAKTLETAKAAVEIEAAELYWVPPPKTPSQEDLMNWAKEELGL
jgi:hypothetical protein